MNFATIIFEHFLTKKVQNVIEKKFRNDFHVSQDEKRLL